MKTQPTKLDYRILESMELRGGGFASALARAAYRADDVNFAKLKGAFSELWEHHAMLVNHCSKRFSKLLNSDS
jgi:hypothetical protein